MAELLLVAGAGIEPAKEMAYETTPSTSTRPTIRNWTCSRCTTDRRLLRLLTQVFQLRMHLHCFGFGPVARFVSSGAKSGRSVPSFRLSREWSLPARAGRPCPTLLWYRDGVEPSSSDLQSEALPIELPDQVLLPATLCPFRLGDIEGPVEHATSLPRTEPSLEAHGAGLSRLSRAPRGQSEPTKGVLSSAHVPVLHAGLCSAEGLGLSGSLRLHRF